MDWLEEALQLEATPKTSRPMTVTDFLAKHNVSSSTYYYQVSKEENQKKILKIVLNRAKERAPSILEKLGDLAENGDMRAIDSYMDMILQLSKNFDIKTDGKPILQISEAIANKNSLNATTPSTEQNS